MARKWGRRYRNRGTGPPGGPTAICRDCGCAKPIGEFYRETASRDDDGGNATRRRRSLVCHACSIARSIRSRRTREWNWAAAVVKSKAMQVAASNADGAWSGLLDKGVVEALTHIQNFKCAVTGMILELPKDLATGQTLDGWADARNIPVRDRSRLPELVRVDSSGPWEPGNVAVACRAAAPLAAAYDSISTLRAALRAESAEEFTSPTLESIAARRAVDDAAFAAEMRSSWKNEHEIENKKSSTPRDG